MRPRKYLPAGPPDWLKPSHETYGEILLATNRPKEAAAQFAISLRRQPNRGRSLLGAARAAAAGGERAGAAAAYSDFLRVAAGRRRVAGVARSQRVPGAS
jgi:predicted Zn-dependent protease